MGSLGIVAAAEPLLKPKVPELLLPGGLTVTIFLRSFVEKVLGCDSSECETENLPGLLYEKDPKSGDEAPYNNLGV